MKFFFLILTSLACVSVNLPAQVSFDSIVSKDPSCACDPMKMDPFEDPFRYTKGRLRGACIDSCRFRWPKRQGKEDGTEVIYNLLHQDKYWKFMRSDVNLVGASIIFEKFMDPISHVAIRFNLKSSLKLVSVAGNETAEILDIVYSPEAALPSSERQKFLPSLLGDYVFAHRLLSLEQTKNWMIIQQGHKVDQFQLNMSRNQVQKLFERIITNTADLKQEEIYLLLKKNCSTTIADFLILDRPTQLEHFLRIFPVSIDLGLLSFLKRQGLVDFKKSNKIHFPN